MKIKSNTIRIILCIIYFGGIPLLMNGQKTPPKSQSSSAMIINKALKLKHKKTNITTAYLSAFTISADQIRAVDTANSNIVITYYLDFQNDYQPIIALPCFVNGDRMAELAFIPGRSKPFINPIVKAFRIIPWEYIHRMAALNDLQYSYFEPYLDNGEVSYSFGVVTTSTGRQAPMGNANPAPPGKPMKK